MQIRISASGVELLNVQEAQIKEKLSSLERYTKRFGSGSILNLTIKRATHHQVGDIYIMQASFSIPGKDITIEVQGGSIEETTDKLRDKLKDLIIENRKTKESKWRKLARKLKDKFRSFTAFRH